MGLRSIDAQGVAYVAMVIASFGAYPAIQAGTTLELRASSTDRSQRCLAPSATSFSPSALPFSGQTRICCGALTSAGGKL